MNHSIRTLKGPGGFWDVPAPVIYRKNLFALLSTADVPEGVKRTVGRTMGDSVPETYKELRRFPRCFTGPNHEDGFVCVVSLDDLPEALPVGPKCDT